MNCKKAKRLILTDYLDGEMDRNGKAAFEKHLEGCQKCREFSVTAKKVGNELFLGADRAGVPEYLWRRVRETILTEENDRKNYAPGFFGRLRAILYIPKPVLAVAAAIILFIAIGTMTRLKIDNQVKYFDYLTEASADNLINDSGGFGTQIEKYFM